MNCYFQLKLLIHRKRRSKDTGNLSNGTFRTKLIWLFHNAKGSNPEPQPYQTAPCHEFQVESSGRIMSYFPPGCFLFETECVLYIAETGPQHTMLSSKQEAALDSQVLRRKEIIITKCRWKVYSFKQSKKLCRMIFSLDSEKTLRGP